MSPEMIVQPRVVAMQPSVVTAQPAVVTVPPAVATKPPAVAMVHPFLVIVPHAVAEPFYGDRAARRAHLALSLGGHLAACLGCHQSPREP